MDAGDVTGDLTSDVTELRQPQGFQLNVVVGSVTAASGAFSGNVGGTLSYQDVNTVITAQQSIQVAGLDKLDIYMSVKKDSHWRH